MKKSELKSLLKVITEEVIAAKQKQLACAIVTENRCIVTGKQIGRAHV